MLSCAFFRAVATSMFELPWVRGVDGSTPLAAIVEQDPFCSGIVSSIFFDFAEEK